MDNDDNLYKYKGVEYMKNMVVQYITDTVVTHDMDNKELIVSSSQIFCETSGIETLALTLVILMKCKSEFFTALNLNNNKIQRTTGIKFKTEKDKRFIETLMAKSISSVIRDMGENITVK
ncbi:MAG: hypothetical protein ACRCZ9_08330 [Fusobacteriaceae bacterium]